MVQRRLLGVVVLVASVVALLAGSAQAAPAVQPTWSMAAHTSFTRTYAWVVHKSVSSPSVTLAPGQTTTVGYTVSVGSGGSTDSDWLVQDGILLQADNIFTATNVAATIQPDGVSATIDCGAFGSQWLLPFTGTFLACHYVASLTNGNAPKQTVATVTFDDASTASYTLNWDWSGAAITTKDACANVTDTLQGSLGQVCVGDPLPKTFTYTRTIGPYATCGEYTVNNTATSTGVDTGATSSDSASVAVHVTCPPPPACPRTIGYWKTHDGSGPQADVVSSLLPVWLGTAGGPKSVNVTSTALSNQLLSFGGSNNVVSSSNGINKLYAQLLAAKLNGRNGADISSVASPIAAADAFLATHDSTYWNGLSKSDKVAVLAWMTALDDYNNGGGC